MARMCPGGTIRRPRQVRLAVACVGIAWVGLLLYVGRPTTWVIDNTVKLLQAEALVGSGFADGSLPLAGRGLDPDFRFSPLVIDRFAAVVDGRLHALYSPLFARISALALAVGGVPATLAITLLSSLGMLLGVARLARILGHEPPVPAAAALVAGLLTPLWFYAVTLWEYAPALCCVVWGTCLLVDRRSAGPGAKRFAGAALLGLSTAFRTELVLLAAAMILMAALARPPSGRRSPGPPLAGAAAGLVPVWIFQWATVGKPFGVHAAHLLRTSGSLAGHLADRPRVFYSLFLAAHPSVAVSLAASAMLAVPLLAAWRGRRQESAAGWLILPATAAFTLVVIQGIGAAPNPAIWLIRSGGFFAASPLLAVALLSFGLPTDPSPAGEAARSLRRASLAYALGYALLAPLASSVGIHWGGRFLLPLYPFAVVLAVGVAARLLPQWRLRHGPALLAGGLAVAGTALLQLHAAQLLAGKEAFSREVAAILAARREEVLVTDLHWAVQEVGEGVFRKPLLYAPRPGDRREVETRLAAAGVGRYLMLGRPSGVPETGGTVIVRDGTLGFFDLEIRPVDVPAPVAGGRE